MQKFLGFELEVTGGIRGTLLYCGSLSLTPTLYFSQHAVI